MGERAARGRPRRPGGQLDVEERCPGLQAVVCTGGATAGAAEDQRDRVAAPPAGTIDDLLQ